MAPARSGSLGKAESRVDRTATTHSTTHHLISFTQIAVIYTTKRFWVDFLLVGYLAEKLSSAKLLLMIAGPVRSAWQPLPLADRSRQFLSKLTPPSDEGNEPACYYNITQ